MSSLVIISWSSSILCGGHLELHSRRWFITLSRVISRTLLVQLFWPHSFEIKFLDGLFHPYMFFTLRDLDKFSADSGPDVGMLICVWAGIFFYIWWLLFVTTISAGWVQRSIYSKPFDTVDANHFFLHNGFELLLVNRELWLDISIFAQIDKITVLFPRQKPIVQPLQILREPDCFKHLLVDAIVLLVLTLWSVGL